MKSRSAIRSIALPAVMFLTMSATATAAFANGGSMGGGASTPSSPATTSTTPCVTPDGRTNCHGWSGPIVSPNVPYSRWRPGYISSPEVLKGVRPGPSMVLPPGVNAPIDFIIPHLGAITQGGPDHSFVIYPGGRVAQRFDMDDARYRHEFDNLNQFRGQEFPLGSRRTPFTGSNVQIYCPRGCTQHR